MTRDVRSDSWQTRFRVPWMTSAAVAPLRPERGLVASNRDGRFQLFAWDVSTGSLRPLTDHSGGINHGTITPDGSHVLYLADTDGNETGHLVRVPFGGGPVEDLTPDLPAYGTTGWAVAASGRRLVAATGGEGGQALVAVDLDPNGAIGPARVLRRSARNIWWPHLASDGALAAASTTDRTGDIRTTLVAVDAMTGDVVAELDDGDGASVDAGPFAPTGVSRLVGTSNRTGDSRPCLWWPRTGERIDLPVDHLFGDVYPAAWSSDGERVLLLQEHCATRGVHLYHVRSGATASVTLPAGLVTGVTFGPSDSVLVTWEDATQPACVLSDAAGREPSVVLAGSTSIPGHALRSIEFASADGTVIHGWLGTPDGSGPFPTILQVHGGPWWADMGGFDPVAQAWLDRGFAYLSVNYRGSLSFGREFSQQIVGRPGDLELDDMVAARDWLVRQGIAEPDLVFPAGSSYGGYLVLHALGRRPELWAGGLAGAPVADWAMLWEGEADHQRAFDTARFGGTPAELPERWCASSPLTYVDDVAAPVQVIQGRNDTTTRPGPVVEYVERLRARGAPVELVWYDSGHLGAYGEVEQAIELQARKMAFAERIVREHRDW